MKILFLMRHDFIEKSGGDVVQISAYVSELKKLGHVCTIVGTINKLLLDDNEVFFLVNIDRPIETLRYYDYISKNKCNKKIYLVPIHHPIDAVNRFESNNKGVAYKIFSLLFADFYRREQIKNFVRFRKNARLLWISALHFFVDYRKRIARLIESVDGVIYIADAERQSIESDFSTKSKKSIVVHNAVEFDFCSIDNLDQRKYDIIVVGRIEERKNQLSIAAAFAKTKFRVVFVGPKNSNSIDYFDRFAAIVASSDNLTYLGSATHVDTLKLIASSHLLFNGSYFEVSPLVDLEAGIMRTHVVTTKYSYTSEIMPNVINVDPWLPDEFVRAAEIVLIEEFDTLHGASIESGWAGAAFEINQLISC